MFRLCSSKESRALYVTLRRKESSSMSLSSREKLFNVFFNEDLRKRWSWNLSSSKKMILNLLVRRNAYLRLLSTSSYPWKLWCPWESWVSILGKVGHTAEKNFVENKRFKNFFFKKYFFAASFLLNTFNKNNCVPKGPINGVIFRIKMKA